MSLSTGYLGAKSGSGVFQAIISQMPLHDRYIEAFLGSGAVMRTKPQAAMSIGIDLDPEPLKGLACDYPAELLK